MMHSASLRESFKFNTKYEIQARSLLHTCISVLTGIVQLSPVDFFFKEEEEEKRGAALVLG